MTAYDVRYADRVTRLSGGEGFDAMANYTAARSVHKTLTANAADFVTLSRPNWVNIEIVNRSTTDAIYFTVNSTTDPVIEGDDTFVVPPYSSYTVADESVSTPSRIRLISSGAAPYSVIGQGAS